MLFRSLPGDADSYARNTISLRGNMKYKRFSAELNLNYVRKDITQAAAGQGDDGATMFSEILQHAVDVDISSMKDYTNPILIRITSIQLMRRIHIGC